MGLLDSFQEMDDIEDTRQMITNLRAPFKYPGCKVYAVEELAKYIPYRKIYVEVFGGSAAVLLSRERSILEVLNDRHSGICAFYRCLRDKMDALINRLELTCHSREEFIFCKNWKDVADDVERAARWYYIQEYSFAGIGRYYGRVTNSFPAVAIQERFPLFPVLHERLKRVQIENLDYTTCIRDYDSSDAVFYLDPPYLNTPSNTYMLSFTLGEHKKLLNMIMDMKGFVALSGFANELYDSYSWDKRIELSCKTGGTFQPSKSDYAFDRSNSVSEILWIKE